MKAKQVFEFVNPRDKNRGINIKAGFSKIKEDILEKAYNKLEKGIHPDYFLEKIYKNEMLDKIFIYYDYSLEKPLLLYSVEYTQEGDFVLREVKKRKDHIKTISVQAFPTLYDLEINLYSVL